MKRDQNKKLAIPKFVKKCISEIINICAKVRKENYSIVLASNLLNTTKLT